MNDGLAQAAKLLAEPARAAMLLRLMSGQALPAGQLALAGNVSPQTASEHLAKLAEGGFVTAYQQGRHRYYCLAAPEVADVVESLLVLTSGLPNARGEARCIPALGSIEHARTCYSHIAGWLGVAIADGMQRKGLLTRGAARSFVVTANGKEWLQSLGLSLAIQENVADPKYARQCLDWTERRPHLAGKLGVALHKHFLVSGWIAPTRKARTLRVTLEGRLALQKHLGIAVG